MRHFLISTVALLPLLGFVGKLPAAPPKVIEPTEQELKAAIDAFKELRLEHEPLDGFGSRVPRHRFAARPQVGGLLKDTDLMRFPKVPFSYGLNLYYTDMTDEGVKELATFPNLIWLQTPMQVTDKGLKELSASKELSTLGITSANGISDAGLTEVAKVKTLTRVFLPSGPRMTAAGFQKIASLPELSELFLGGEEVTDDWLKKLVDARKLSFLVVESSRFTDAGMNDISQLKGLTTLTLNFNSLVEGESKVTAAGFKEIVKLPQLSELTVDGEQVTDAWLKELRVAKSLSSLSVQSTQLTDAGMKDIARLNGLTTLRITGNPKGTRVTDAGVKELAQLPELRTLSLEGHGITDAGLLRELVKFKKLSELYLDHTGTTNAGRAQLRKALPKCSILVPL